MFLRLRKRPTAAKELFGSVGTYVGGRRLRTDVSGTGDAVEKELRGTEAGGTALYYGDGPSLRSGCSLVVSDDRSRVAFVGYEQR